MFANPTLERQGGSASESSRELDGKARRPKSMTPRNTSPSQAMSQTLASVLAAVAVATLLTLPAVASAATFNPLNVFSDETLRASGSMSRADIQSFLDAQPGVLKTYSAPEGGPNGAHSTVVKPASQIIAEAAAYWNVNPKIIMATLEKEQSLISAPNHVASASHTYGTAYHLEHAMGCGVYPSSKDTHPGFGDQVWTGTQKLGQTTDSYAWYAGKPKQVYSYPDGHDIIIVPANQITWNLYTYTPYYPQISVWNIYNKFFGDPQSPPRLMPMYHFYNKTTGAYFFTTSEAERWRVVARKQSYISFQGTAFTIDTSSTANVVPLYRMYNKAGERYFYTASERELAAAKRLRHHGKPTYTNLAVVAKVSLTTGAPVYRLYCRRTNSTVWTTSAAEKAALMRTKQWKYNGVAFFLGE
jgi:hypothetical protein